MTPPRAELLRLFTPQVGGECLSIRDTSRLRLLEVVRVDPLHVECTDSCYSHSQGSAMECAAAIDLLRVSGHVTLADATRAKH